MAKVKVVAETLSYTDKDNVLRVYEKGQVFDMADEELEQNVETEPASADGKQRARTALGGRPSVVMADKAASVSEPVLHKVVKPAPAPAPANLDKR